MAASDVPPNRDTGIPHAAIISLVATLACYVTPFTCTFRDIIKYC